MLDSARQDEDALLPERARITEPTAKQPGGLGSAPKMSLKVRLQEQEDKITELEKELAETHAYNDHLLDELEQLRGALERSEGFHLLII